MYRPIEHDCLLGCFLCILCRDVADNVKLEFWLQPGDLQVVHNQTQVHNRSAYEDHDVSFWDAGAQHAGILQVRVLLCVGRRDQDAMGCCSLQAAYSTVFGKHRHDSSAGTTQHDARVDSTSMPSSFLHVRTCGSAASGSEIKPALHITCGINTTRLPCVPQYVDLRRHLLRLWVAPSAEDGAHPLAPAFAELYHSTEPGNRGGIYIDGYTETIPLEAEVGNKLLT